MRYCHYCKKPMYTSNYGIHINDVTYEAHKGCVSKVAKMVDDKENMKFKA